MPRRTVPPERRYRGGAQDRRHRTCWGEPRRIGERERRGCVLDNRDCHPLPRGRPGERGRCVSRDCRIELEVFYRASRGAGGHKCSDVGRWRNGMACRGITSSTTPATTTGRPCRPRRAGSAGSGRSRRAGSARSGRACRPRRAAGAAAGACSARGTGRSLSTSTTTAWQRILREGQ